MSKAWLIDISLKTSFTTNNQIRKGKNGKIKPANGIAAMPWTVRPQINGRLIRFIMKTAKKTFGMLIASPNLLAINFATIKNTTPPTKVEITRFTKRPLQDPTLDVSVPRRLS